MKQPIGESKVPTVHTAKVGPRGKYSVEEILVKSPSS